MKIFKNLENILLLLATLIIFFIIIEAGFKILHIFSDSEVGPSSIDGLPYENTPNGWFIRYNRSNGWIFYKNNSLGMRDVERSFTKPDYVKRIICLGDSIMFGGEVSFNEIFSRRLERMLKEELNKDIEVLNCGTTSYSLSEYITYLNRKAIKFTPGLVIVGLCLNDYSKLPQQCNLSQDNQKNKLSQQSILFKRVKRFIFHSYFLEYIRERLKKIDKSQGILEDQRALSVDNWMPTRQSFIQLRDICYTNGIDLIVVIFPVSSQLKDASGETQPQKFIKEMLGDLKIYYVDLLEIYSKYQSEGLRVYSQFDSIHPLSLGHKLAANAVKDKIFSEAKLLNILRK